VARHLQSDFSILLNVDYPFAPDRYVKPLTAETMQDVWPKNLSAKVRILAEAYLDPEMLAC